MSRKKHLKELQQIKAKEWRGSAPLLDFDYLVRLKIAPSDRAGNQNIDRHIQYG